MFAVCRSGALHSDYSTEIIQTQLWNSGGLFVCIQSYIFWVVLCFYSVFCTAPSARGSWFLVWDLGCYENRNLSTISRRDLVIYCQFCEEIICLRQDGLTLNGIVTLWERQVPSQVNTRSPILFGTVYFSNTMDLSKKGRIGPLVFEANCRQLMGTCHLHEVQSEFSPLLMY